MTLLTTSQQLIATGTSDGGGFTFQHRLYAWISDIREGYVKVNVEYRVYGTSSQYSSYAGTWGNQGGCYSRDPVNGLVTRREPFYTTWSMDTEYSVFSYSFDVDARSDSGWSGNIAVWTVYPYVGASESTRAEDSAQAFAGVYGTSGSDIVVGINTISANVSVQYWGGGGSTTDRRYRQLSVWKYSTGIGGGARRYQTSYGFDKSGTIEVNNSSPREGTMSIAGNTMYYVSAYAATYSSAFGNDWVGSGEKNMGTVITLPYAPTMSLNSVSATSASVHYTLLPDGGQLNKSLEYSLDGETWTRIISASGGLGRTGNWTISGLSANTEYTVQFRVSTSAGQTAGNSLTFKTLGPNTPSVTASLVTSAEDSTVRIVYSCSSFNGGLNPYIELYGQDDGSSVWTLLNTETNATAGTNYQYDDVVGGNHKRRYKAVAYATFDGTVAPSSDGITPYITTHVPAATLSGNLGEYSTYNKVNATLSWAVPADYNAYPKQLGYRYSVDGGTTWTNWVYVTTISSGSATTYNENLILDTNTTYIFEGCSLQGTSSVRTLAIPRVTLTTPDNHRSPSGFDYLVSDNITGVSDWLSEFVGYASNMLIQSKSVLQVTIPNSTKGVFYDNATLQRYSFSALGQTTTILPPVTYPKTQVFSSAFNTRPSDLAYNEIVLSGEIVDSLAASSDVEKTLILMSYENPTLTISGERLAKIGDALVDFSGTYSRVQNNSLNNGEDVNTIKVEFRVLDIEQNVVVDWTETDNFTTTVDEQKPFLKDFSGRATISGVPIDNTAFIEIRATEHFTSITQRIELDVWDINQFASPTEYDIELWDWKTNLFVADLSYLVIGAMNLQWTLNDIEEVSFDLDLLRYEEKCLEMGVDPNDLLVPYKYDIRIRRNGVYIMGCNLVEANIQLTTEPPAKIQVKGTGYLNLFKDQYILSEAWSGYTYAQIARKLVEAAQKPDALVRNPTIDIDTSYWLAANGTISYSTSSHSGAGCIAGNRSGTGWITLGTQMSSGVNQTISLDVWVKGQSGTICYVRERQYITSSSGQTDIATITLNGDWQHIQVSSYSTVFENSYIIFEMNRTNSTSVLQVDDCYVYEADDTVAYSNLYVELGTDTASADQSSDRQVNYELQNVKDAIMNLTTQEDDNFDFSFTPDRIFNVMPRKGSEKLNLEICYPGNVSSMTITRSASNLANKVVAIGSGIGDERLQTMVYDNLSRGLYGTHESIVTNNNESIIENLIADAQGVLRDRKDPTNLPQVVIRDGSVNPNVVETGDIVLVELKNDTYLASTTGAYRVIKLICEVEEENENVTLTLEKV